MPFVDHLRRPASWAFWCVSFMAVLAAGEEPAWRKAVAEARSELFQTVAAETSEEKVARSLALPWPLPAFSIAPQKLEELIEADVAAKVDAQLPMPDEAEIRRRADTAFPLWKVGDEVDFKDVRGRRIKGHIRDIYPGMLRIGSTTVPRMDIPPEERAHLSKELADKKVQAAITLERQKAIQKRDELRRELVVGVRDELSKLHGFARVDGKWVSPGDLTARVRYARQRQIAFGMRQRETSFMAEKGFVLWEREWVTKEARDGLLEELRGKRQEEQTALAAVATFGQGQRSIQGDMENLVLFEVTMIDNSQARGSGFILKNGFRKYVVTNQHLFIGAKSFTMRTATGTVLRPKAIALAKELDLAEVTFACEKGAAEPPGLELSLVEPEIDAPVLVLGNSQGAGVVTCEPGKVAGVGPDLVEVTAKFVPGNSGSPIINVAGRVVGVATFATRDEPEWVALDSRYSKVRRFGMRLKWDDYPEFAFLDWREFVTESYLLKDLDLYLMDLYSMASAEVTTARDYRQVGNLSKYWDAQWGQRALATMEKYETMWQAVSGRRVVDPAKIVEGVDLTFRGELGVIRNTLATHTWKTGMMKEQAQYLDTVCQILQDIHKDAAAKAMQVLRQ